MFTGIIEETGTVSSIRRTGISSVLTIDADKIFSDLKLGDSVAVNGVCLTASDIKGHSFSADVMNETFQRSSLSELKAGSHVNLERAMASGGRFGGHIVTGHVDATGTIVSIEKDGNAVWYRINTVPDIMKYIVEKGSIAIDGISLTVAKLYDDGFSVSVIPHTASHTILSEKKAGNKVNLENDIIGKYVERLMGFKELKTAQSSIDIGFLAKNGYI